MTENNIDDGGNGDDVHEAQRLALRDLLSVIDPCLLNKEELIMMTDVLGKALAAFGDPPAEVGDQLIV